MQQKRHLDIPRRDLAKEFRLLLGSSYWDYVDQENRKKNLSLFGSYQDCHPKPE